MAIALRGTVYDCAWAAAHSVQTVTDNDSRAYPTAEDIPQQLDDHNGTSLLHGVHC